jgi:transposase
MGRRTKLTKKTKDIICAVVSRGMTIDTAADAAGITKTTIMNWLNRGEKARKGIYFDFFVDFKKARVLFEDSNLKKIDSCADDGTWQAAAWRLERAMPEKYGKNVVHVQVQDTSGIDSLLKAIGDHASAIKKQKRR